AATLYLRRHPIAAGIALGIGTCLKEVAIYLLAVLVALEALRLLRAWWTEGSAPDWVRQSLRPLLIAGMSTITSFFLLLWLLDVLVPAYDPGARLTYGGSPFTHLFHIYHFALLLKATPNAVGISSTPWEWLLNQKPIDYARVAVNSTVNGKVVASHPVVFFQ